jgi:tetratricopeptide (TPR) repeat protein
MKKRFTKYLLLFICFLAGCKNDNGGGSETADQLVQDGWQAYLSKDYKTATSKFNQALAMNSSLVDAYNGAGWSYALLNRLDSSVNKFNLGRSRDTANTGINAGLGIVENALKSYQSSIAYAEIVLRQNSSWTFNRDNTINWSDLRVLLAEDFFALMQYDSCLAQIQTLTPDTTRAVDSLAAKIEALRLLYGN